jgi:hypothetical protein
MACFKQGNGNNRKDEKRTNMNRNEERAEKKYKKSNFPLEKTYPISYITT